MPVSYTHLDVYKRQVQYTVTETRSSMVNPADSMLCLTASMTARASESVASNALWVVGSRAIWPATYSVSPATTASLKGADTPAGDAGGSM